MFDGGLPGGVVAEVVVVIEVFVAVAEAEDPLADEGELGMFDERGVAQIRQRGGDGPGEAEAAVNLAQEREAAVAGHLAARKTGGDAAFFYGWKSERGWVTNCGRRSDGFCFHSPQ